MMVPAVCLPLLLGGCGAKSNVAASSMQPSVGASQASTANPMFAPGAKAAKYHAQDPKSVGPNGEYAGVVATQKQKMNTNK